MDSNNNIRRAADFDQLYPGRFLKAGTLNGKQVTLQISDVHVEHLEGDGGKKWKGVITFHKTDMQLVLNKTNGTCLKEMFGREVPKWIGRRITLFPSEWNGEPCIRIWGSPELERDKTITITLPKRKPITMVMHAVRANGQRQAPAREERRAPPPDVDNLVDDDEEQSARQSQREHERRMSATYGGAAEGYQGEHADSETYERDENNPF